MFVTVFGVGYFSNTLLAKKVKFNCMSVFCELNIASIILISKLSVAKYGLSPLRKQALALISRKYYLTYVNH